MTDADIHRIEFKTDWPPWTVAAYLVDGDEPVLVDAGAPGDDSWDALVDGLAAVGFTPDDIAHLLVTHPHTDHDGQVASLVEAAEPTVYTLAAARDRLRMDEQLLAARVRSNARAVGLDEDGVEQYVDQAISSVERNRSYFPPEAVDVALADGDRFEAGRVEFEVVHTPGHQRDHACFAARIPESAGRGARSNAWSGADRLFAGDQVIEPFRAAALNVGLDDGVFESIDEFYAGYRGLTGRSFERVYPGHGPVFDEFDAAVERSVASLDELVAETATALSNLGEATAVEVDERRVDERRDYTLFETAGALGFLENSGDAESSVEDGVIYYSSRSSNF